MPSAISGNWRTSDGRVEARADGLPGRMALRGLVAATPWLMAATAMLLVERRLEGALIKPLAGLQNATAGCIIGLLVAGMGARGGPTARAALFVSALAIAVVLSLPGSSVFGLAVLWMLTGGSIAVAAGKAPLLGVGARRRLFERWPVSEGWSNRIGPRFRRRPHVVGDIAKRQVIARFERIELSEGRQVLRGYLRLRLKKGQRSTVAHVAFCPPFDTLPEIRATAAADRLAIAPRVNVGQILHNGARLEIKLAAPAAQACWITCDFRATGAVGRVAAI